MSADLRALDTTDIVIGVILGVIARIYMIFASPIVNVMLHGLGPLGDTLWTPFIAVNVMLVALPLGLRKNGIPCVIAGTTMGVVRLLTGDPFGVQATLGYFLGTLAFWVAAAGLNYKLNWRNWFISLFAFVWVLEGVFGVFWGIWPLFESMVLGYIKYLFIDRIVETLFATIFTVPIVGALLKVQSLRILVRQRPEK